MADVDEFKLYNDSFGHTAGDHCIQQIADSFKQAIHRPGDLAARYGGEEIIVFLAATNRMDAGAIGEKIRTAVESLRIGHFPSKKPPVVTVSIGIATALPAELTDAQALIEAADAALYKAKRQGRNRVCVAE